MKSFVLALLFSAVAVAAQAQFNFVTNNGSITITGYTGDGGNVVIPSSTNGFPVTDIGKNAFWLSGPSTVTIPDSVTTIEEGAFSFCWVLTSVTVGNGVKTIGQNAFSYCSRLTTLTIPDSVTAIDDDAFSSCYGLTNVVIGDSVAMIGDGAFFACSGLTNVTIPDSVTTISNDAFSSCSSLIDVTIGNGVTTIGQNAFSSCSRLSNFSVAEGNPAYAADGGILFNASLTTLVQYPAGLPQSAYAVPNSVTTIGNGAFFGCSSLTNVAVGSSVTTISVEAFAECSGLTNVAISDRVTEIGDGGFLDCSGLTSVTIPESVTNIGEGAFQGCTHLAAAYFQGNAPLVDGGAGSLDASVFRGESVMVYYVPGTSGWGSTFGGWPTAMWYQPEPQVLGAGYGLSAPTNGFQFTVSWGTNATIIIEASTNLSNPVWVPLATNILVGGTNFFSDPLWTNYPERYYRVRVP